MLAYSAALLVPIVMLAFLPSLGRAAEKQKIETSMQRFSVRLGSSRVIYNPSSTGETLTVTNPQNYPILVQSQVFANDMKTKAPFIVTPPLFRLDGQQQSRLLIVRTGDVGLKDRESLQWLCVKGIPPKADDVWTKDQNGKAVVEKKVSVNVQVSIDNCIKLIVRPENIQGQSGDVASSLIWHRQGNQIKGINNTPFYMNLASLKVGGIDIHNIHYIPPFSSYIFNLPSGLVGNNVSWTVINDYGGESKVYQADM
ncbi:fimbria/pilus periplasmic chaperone [Edwardsiella piscicida]|nr:fimbria/pilus periplasmic chaperone [Edwardsiella piscicida]